MQSLDLYAKIEPLIGFYEAYEELYDEYEKIISEIKPKTLLDVGCGNGNFLKRFYISSKDRFAQTASLGYPETKSFDPYAADVIRKQSFDEDFYIDAKGIDISPKMVEISQKKGLNVSCKKIEEVDEKFDVITAIADVLNYLDEDELKSFLEAVKACLNDGGYFICDINTFYGFSEVADGVMVSEDEEGFLAVEAEFLDGELATDFTYFEKSDKCYQKHQWRIRQYYHKIDKIKNLLKLSLIDTKEIKLFSDEDADKTLLVFKK